MSILDDYVDRAGSGAVLMVSEAAFEDMKHNTDPGDWKWFPKGRSVYRGAEVEHHDEWSWGWMVRKADGTYVEEPAKAIEAQRAETNADSVPSSDESAVPKGFAQ